MYSDRETHHQLIPVDFRMQMFPDAGALNCADKIKKEFEISLTRGILCEEADTVKHVSASRSLLHFHKRLHKAPAHRTAQSMQLIICCNKAERYVTSRLVGGHTNNKRSPHLMWELVKRLGFSSCVTKDQQTQRCELKHCCAAHSSVSIHMHHL